MNLRNVDDEPKALSPGVKKLGLLIFLGIPLVFVLLYFIVVLLKAFGIITPG